MVVQELDFQHEAAMLEMAEDYLENDIDAFKALFGRTTAWTAKEFAAFIKQSQSERLDWRPGPNKVSKTRYVLVDDNQKICGNGLMQFPLVHPEGCDGGNLIFNIPPHRRGSQYGALILNGMLFEAVKAGMARVLVTCPADNRSMITDIERNRGDFEKTIECQCADGEIVQINRYWIHFR